ncbi:phosphatase PAP2 family protein [Streptomyces sp. MAR25Y5]|uniref:phosphatase PAP2 family protein n=1 Tax=Streptomyces sp. MAR25Y5 TaxID=2962028 RepID=UPI0020B70BC2|nr:phosphatase PAP2 family protein [Streptomyces sp. MAR25Y5]MCP3765806.1 phosphatase PAP2 family protein [Streptomyces sp. MAR25Y5]
MGETTVTTLEGRHQAAAHPVEDPTGQSLLRRLRAPRRPRLWFEILLIAVSYWTYSLIRNAVPEQKSQALRNADLLWDLEQRLGLAFEQSVNHAVNSVTWLVVGMNYYYATLHFVVTLGVLVWLYRSHPGRYAATRLVLFSTTVVALAGYYLFPLAPPRLMNGGAFVDTVMVHETWGSMASGDLKNMSNQYAAMPSMHIGWSVWCGLTVFALATAPWAKILGLLYPAGTLVVIVATANHFWLDAVGGVLCLAFGYALATLWYKSKPYALPREVPDDGSGGGRDRGGRDRAGWSRVLTSRPFPGTGAPGKRFPGGRGTDGTVTDPDGGTADPVGGTAGHANAGLVSPRAPDDSPGPRTTDGAPTTGAPATGASAHAPDASRH